MPFNGYVVDVMREEDGTVYLRQNVKKNTGVLDDELSCLRHSLLEHEAEQYMRGYDKALRQMVSRLRENGVLKDDGEEKVKLRKNEDSAYLVTFINQYFVLI